MEMSVRSGSRESRSELFGRGAKDTMRERKLDLRVLKRHRISGCIQG